MVQMEISQVGGLSIRERNRARRKARQLVSKQRSIDNDELDEPKRKRSKIESRNSLDNSESTPDVTGSWGNVSIFNSFLKYF
jgi:hypothetical protein